MAGDHAVFINDRRELKAHLADIDVDKGAYPFLLPKGRFQCLKLKRIPCRAAHIIKQEMLSKGGEAAIGRQAMTAAGFSEGYTDILLMGTAKQYQMLVEKLKIQPFGLNKTAIVIETLMANLDKNQWTLVLPKGEKIELGHKTLVMGILNLTPDSFSDGGKYENTKKALAHAEAMISAGADCIDVGAVSSRPQGVLADENTEIERILPVIKELVKTVPSQVYISVDTFRAKTAAACLKLGVHIINDIGRLQMDKEMGAVIKDFASPVVLMHNRMHLNAEQPYEDLVADIIGELSASIGEAVDSGIEENKIMVDPGLGFGKTVKENLALVKCLADFKSLGRPILIGASRKNFIGQTLNLEVAERLEGSLAVAAAAIMNGAHLIRTHDVQATKRLAVMLDAVKNHG